MVNSNNGLMVIPRSGTYITMFTAVRDQSKFKLGGGREGGEGGGEIGGPPIFFGWNMGGLKMPKDDLGGSLSFF